MGQLSARARSAALVIACLLGACGKPASQNEAKSGVPATASSAQAQALSAENAQLKAEVARLKAQVEALSVTAQTLLDRVSSALAADDLEQARTSVDTLEQRFAQSPQAKAARAQLARAEARQQQKQALAKQLEARGFYALPTTNAAQVDDITLKVESIEFGERWTFDSRSDEWSYREAERGQRFLLLKTTIQSNLKNPMLPDVAVYRIDGKQMALLERLRYEFRRWEGYGNYIGLYHDFRNDFAHSPAVSFNAAASIDAELTRQPLAVVVTGEMCHEKETRIGQPAIGYSPRYDCKPKAELSLEDFTKGKARVLSFLNKPKGV